MTTASTRRERTLLSRLGRLDARHSGWVVVIWLLAVAAAFAGATGAFGNESLFNRLASGEPSVSGEATQGRDLIQAAGPPQASTHMLQVTGVDVTDPAVAATARRYAARLGDLQGVAGVAMPFLVAGGVDSPAAAPLLRDGNTSGDGFITVVTLQRGLSGTAERQVVDRVDRQFTAFVADLPGATGTTGGVSQLVHAITSQVESDLRRGEGIALPVSFLVMVGVFGGFIAAGMPILGAIASIGGALASLLGFSYLIDLDATVVNVVTVLGLGLCIDYGLLIVSRFREELRRIARGRPVAQVERDEILTATARTVDSAGRTVLFSGVTVAISLGGLLLFDATILKAIGAAGLSVVAVAILVALTLIPALCRLGARRLLRRGTELAPEEGVFSRLASRVYDYPVPVIVLVLAVLVTLALPVLDMRLTSSGSELLPTSSPERQFFASLDQHYPSLAGPDVQVVVRTTPARARDYAAHLPEIGGTPLRGSVETLGPELSVISIDTRGGSLGDPARDAVVALRADRPDFPTYVTGRAASLADFTASVRQRAPAAGVLVALTTLVLLFLMTGSVVIPIKALLLNVVSLAASLGVVVWIFQDGHLEGLLGFSSVGAIESTIPMLILAFGFGLSMDYEVFLLSRIVELHEHGHGNREAIVLGLQRSGRIITSAAILVVIVFAGFIAGQLLVVKETGVGLAVAVLLDATLVRMLLVPATMAVLGDWNWWAPRRLLELHARFGVTE